MTGIVVGLLMLLFLLVLMVSVGLSMMHHVIDNLLGDNDDD